MVVMELWPQPGSGYARVGQAWFNGKPSNRGAVQQLSFCETVEYTIDTKPGAGMDATPCVASYVEGFAPPQLLTDVANVSF